MKVVVVPPTIAFRIENVGIAPLVEMYIGCSFFQVLVGMPLSISTHGCMQCDPCTQEGKLRISCYILKLSCSGRFDGVKTLKWVKFLSVRTVVCKMCSVELANELPKSLHTSFPLLRIKSGEGDWWKRGSLLKIQILLEKSDSVCICVIIQCYMYQYCCIFLNRKWNLLQGRKLLTVKWGKTNMTDLIHTKKMLKMNL